MISEGSCDSEDCE